MKRIAAALLILAGCTTQAKFEQLAAMQLGMTEMQIIDRLGPPAGRYDAGGARYLTWSATKQAAPAYTSNLIGNSVVTVPIGGRTLSCALTYKMEPNRVIDMTDPAEPEAVTLIATSYTYKGNNCRD